MNAPQPVVHVLMATFNGTRHLPLQWASLEAQRGVGIVLHLADDGSSDDTVAVLERLAAARGGALREVRWLHAPPRRSAARSFLQLLRHAVELDPQGAWFAFCDQDDVWLPDKLAHAVAALDRADPDLPALYGGRTLSVDEADRPRGLSPLFARPPAFRNALVQSIMGGNTMVMNRAAALLVAQAADAQVAAHDWLAYQLVSAAGGTVRYDPEPCLRYRQHGANAVGSNIGWAARWHRLGRVLRGDYRQWNELHVGALLRRAEVFTAENLQVLQSFCRAREERNPLARLGWLRRSGVYRQTPAQQAMLWLACLLRRI